MALTTYTNFNVTNDPITMSVLDTGVGSGPADRVATATPIGGYVSVAVASDYGIATVQAVRARCFEPSSYIASIDPGLATNG